jgi:peptide/nickel transport system permease protein
MWLARLAPGDVTSEMALDASPAEIARVRERFGLDRPIVSQWAAWVWQTTRLDFGESALYERPVGGLVRQAAANTALLAVVALVAAIVVGIPLGIFTGSRPEGVTASAVRGASLACLAMPPLVTSLVVVWIAARTGWFPVGGMTSVHASGLAWAPWMADVARHLPLPCLALALPIAATLERLQSQSMSEAWHEPFVRAAAARGLPPGRLLARHAWPVSLPPICGLFGVIVGSVLSGSFVVEYVVAWPGLGRLTYDALRARDVYLVAGCAAAGASLLALGTLLADLLLALIDPRVRQTPEHA